MTGRQRLAIGIGGVGVFLLSVAVGGLVGRQLHAPAPTTFVALASATPAAPPTPAVTAPPSTSAISTPLPLSTATPVGSTTAPPTLAPTATATPSVAPTLDPATAQDFAADLLAALQTADTKYLDDRLHPAVIDRYGADQCAQHVDTFQPDPTAQWTVVSASGPAAWSWATDNLSTVIPDAWTVTVNEPGTGQRDLHFAPSDGTWRWFLDCGDPQ